MPVVVAVLRFEVADGPHILISHYIDRQCSVDTPTKPWRKSPSISIFHHFSKRSPCWWYYVISQFTVFTFCPTYNHLYLKVSWFNSNFWLILSPFITISQSSILVGSTPPHFRIWRILSVLLKWRIISQYIPQKMLKSSKILHFLLLSPPPSPRQVQSFAQWLRDYPAKEKVVIAGHQGSEVQHHNVSQRDWTKEYHGFIRDSSGFIF